MQCAQYATVIQLVRLFLNRSSIHLETSHEAATTEAKKVTVNLGSIGKIRRTVQGSGGAGRYPNPMFWPD